MKYIIFILSFLIILTGCREVIDYDDEVIEAEYVSRIKQKTQITNVYTKTIIELPDGLLYTDYCQYDDKIYFICGNTIVSCDNNGNDIEIIEIPDIIEVVDLVIAYDGSYIIYDGTDIIRMDLDGNITKTIQVDAVGDCIELLTDKLNRIYYFTSKSIIMLSAEGTVIFNMNITGTLNDVYQSTDGTILLNIDDSYVYLDVNKHKFDRTIKLPATLYDYEIIMGDGYELYLLASDLNLYGYLEREIVPITVLNLIDSNINIYDIADFKILSTELMMYDTRDGKIVLLNKIPSNDLPQKNIITLASYGYNEKLINIIIDYNISNTLNHVSLIDYSIYDLDDHIANNKIPDLFILDENLNVDNYIIQGMMVDLNELMEYDTQLSTEDILYNAREPFMYNGELNKLVSNYQIHAFAGKTSVVGSELYWSIYMFEAIIPDIEIKNKQLIANIKPEEMLNLLTTAELDNFLYKNSGYVSGFKNDKFIRMLELSIFIGSEHKYKIPYNNWENENYINNEIVLYYCKFAAPDDYGELKTIFGTEDFTIKGIPSHSGDTGILVEPIRSYAISKSSDVFKGAWEFLKVLMNEYNNYDNYQEEGYFSSLVSTFNEQINSSDSLTDNEKVKLYNLMNYSSDNNNAIKTSLHNYSVFKIINGQTVPYFENAISKYKTAEIIELYVSKYFTKYKNY